MPQPKPQRQGRHFVLLEVILRQFYLAVKNRDQMLRFQLLWCHVRSVALQAEPVPLDPQQVIVVPAVWLMASGAALREYRLVMDGLLGQIGNVAVAAQADLDRVGFGKPWLAAGMGAMTVGTVARGSRMLHFGSLNQFCFIVVASYAQRFDIGLRQYHFPVFRWCMANVTLLVRKRWMHELCHQLGCGRLVRIVTSQAIGFIEWLVLVRLLQVRALGVMAIQTKCR